MQFLRIIWARRMIVLVSTLSALLAAFLVSQILPPRYQAQSRLLLDVRPDPVSGEAIASQFARAYTKTQENLLRDTRVVGMVVDDLGLMKDPDLQEQFRKGGGEDPGEFRSWIAQRIIGNTQAKVVEASNILEITYTGTDPQLVRQIADALRSAYMKATSSFRRESARQTADWYTQQTQKAQARLSEAEAVKTQYERQYGLILQGETDVDNTRLQALAGASVPTASAPISGGVPSSAASGQLAQVEAALSQAAQTLGPNHPEMQDLQRRRAALASQVAQDRAASSAAAGAASRAANAGAGVSSRAYEAQKSRVIAQRDKLDRLRQLQTEVDVRREQYSKTATRAAELRQQAEAPESGLTLLGSAITPERPVFPNMPLILLGGFGFGFAFGILIALLAELLARRVRSAEDMVRAVDVPLLAVISSPSEQKLLEPARPVSVA
jgi:uncharacterized protein involved in exopolysaccharide biosynthesis